MAITLIPHLFTSKISLEVKENALFSSSSIAEYSMNIECVLGREAAIYCVAVEKSRSIAVAEGQHRLQFAPFCSPAAPTRQTMQNVVSRQGRVGFISLACCVSLRGWSLHQAALERFSVVNMPVHGTAVIFLLLEQKFMAMKDRHMWCWVMRLTDLLSHLIAV